MKVVIVDDEYYALEGLKIKLSEIEDIEIGGAYEDSIKFLDEVGTIKPELVLLDVDMPKKNGFEVLSCLRDKEIKVPVIFVTAYRYYKEEILSTNAVDYIIKPVTRERLEEAVIKVKKKTEKD